jgi:hypothetical protein
VHQARSMQYGFPSPPEASVVGAQFPPTPFIAHPATSSPNVVVKSEPQPQFSNPPFFQSPFTGGFVNTSYLHSNHVTVAAPPFAHPSQPMNSDDFASGYESDKSFSSVTMPGTTSVSQRIVNRNSCYDMNGLSCSMPVEWPSMSGMSVPKRSAVISNGAVQPQTPSASLGSLETDYFAQRE